MSKGLHSSLCQNSPLPLDFIFIGVSA